MTAAKTLSALAGVFALGVTAAAPAQAAVMNVFTNRALTTVPFTASFNGGGTLSFTSAVQDGVGPGAAVATGGNAMLATVFGGLGDYGLGTVFDGTASFAAFPTATLIPNSAADDRIGFSYTGMDGVHYGYAEVFGPNLIGYAYETVAGATINGASLVPEPASMALVLGGLAGLGMIRRRRRDSGRVSGSDLAA